MRDDVEADYGLQHGSSSTTPPREIDFLGEQVYFESGRVVHAAFEVFLRQPFAWSSKSEIHTGISPKRNFFRYLSGEPPLARSHNWAESRAPSSGTSEECKRDHLLVTYLFNFTIQKKCRYPSQLGAWIEYKSSILDNNLGV
jgi:hypothetical protein